MKRNLGHSGIQVSALGMGCWAIGGPFWEDPVIAFGIKGAEHAFAQSGLFHFTGHRFEMSGRFFYL